MAFRLEHRIGVTAPPAAIWEVLADIEGWGRWNPLYTQGGGRFGYGETLELTLALPNRKPEVIRPTVADWTPGELVHWKLNLAGGLVRTVRYLEIEVLTETGCIFSNGEIFSGLLSRYVPARLRRDIRAGFNLMGEAVKREAEARWAAQAEGAAGEGRAA